MKAFCNKCCIPECKSNYKSLKKNYHLHQYIIIPRGLTITKTTVVCVKHIEDDDIIRYKSHKFKNISDPIVSL